VHVLLEDADPRVLHRQLVAREGHHLAAALEVQVVEHGLQERIGAEGAAPEGALARGRKSTSHAAGACQLDLAFCFVLHF
jgi:hypothetical protein